MPDPDDIGPKPEAQIEPGEPNPGGADALDQADGVDGEFAEPDPDSRDLGPEVHPAVDEALSDDLKPGAEETEDAAEDGDDEGGNLYDDDEQEPSS